MAWFTYACPEHGQYKINLQKRQSVGSCPQCYRPSVPILKPSTFQVVERLDNGAMARSVERLHNIEEIMEDRADKHSKEVMEKLGANDDEE